MVYAVNVFEPRVGARISTVFIDACTRDESVSRISHWGRERASKYVCYSNVHAVVTAAADEETADAINDADLALPDGAPIAWTLRRKGFSGQARLSGPDMMIALCAEAERADIGVFLFGSTDETLSALREKLIERFPHLRIADSYSPPFRPPSAKEDAAIVERINLSGAGLVFVGLGCPKQEIWMHAHRGRISAVMLGVGAAFDFHAGLVRRAPLWMRQCGLEWLHRLIAEPRRLWKRYVVTNSRFILWTAKDLFLGTPSKKI